jgi:hypothetical protein
MERTIGAYKRLLKSTKDTGVEAGNLLVKNAATNHRALVNNDTKDTDHETGIDSDMTSDSVSPFKPYGRMLTDTASNIMTKMPILTPEILQLLGANGDTMMTTSTKLSSTHDIFYSKSHSAHQKRKKYSLIFKVWANR